MKYLSIILFIVVSTNLHSQKMKIINLDKEIVEVELISESAMNDLLRQFDGKQDNTLRKKWTARTYVLSDGKLILEFFDRQAAVIQNLAEFKKLERVRFVKNIIHFLKKNISYKIELSFEEGSHIVQNEKPIRIDSLKSDMPEHFDFEVYQLPSGQILFIDKWHVFKSAVIYPDIKTLASEKVLIQDQIYEYKEDEHLMKRLASGDALLDYDPNEHLIYSKYEDELIKNHKLSLIEKKVYVDDFYGNLFKSENGYYVLLDDFTQLEVTQSRKISIGTIRIYESLEKIRADQKRYEEFKDKEVYSEHMYKQISDKFGKNFPEFVPQLIDSLPVFLNFDKEQLSLDTAGIDLVDEAYKWNFEDFKIFDSIFPSILAYYGTCYMTVKKDGKWKMYFDKKDKLWIPELRLKNGTAAWDWLDFYKSLYEYPTPLRGIGGWDY